jgi:hypothetical protein
MNQSNGVKTIRLKVDGTNWTGAAGATDLTSEFVDTAGFEGVRLICGFGAIVAGAATSVNAQQCDTSGGTYADLAGTKITVADDDDNQITVIDIFRPRERYIKHLAKRATQNATIDFLVAELYGAGGARKEPVTQDAAVVVAQEVHVSPAEGTA